MDAMNSRKSNSNGRKKYVEQRHLFKDLNFWTLIIVILGAIFNYVFVTRLSNELTNREKQAKMTLDIATFIKDIQPNLQINAGGVKYEDATTLAMYFNISNLGANVVTIEDPTLCLAIQPVFSNDNTKTCLREGTDYQLKNMKIGGKIGVRS